MKIPFRRLAASSWWILLVGALTVSAYTHWRAGFTFPSPWNDEPWFLWTSVELCDTGHWASPSLRPDAPLVLSPLFALANAGLYKLFGIGLGVSRWFSWVCMALAGLAIMDMSRRRPWPWLSAFVVSLFLLGADSVIAGNMARPEAMIWMLATWGFALLDRGKTGQGLLLVALAINLHILGIVFFSGALCIAGVQSFDRIRAKRPWTTREKCWIALAAVTASALVLYNASRFDSTVFTAATQEDTSSIWRRLGISYRWFWLAIGGVAWLHCAFRKRDHLCCLSLALLGLLPLVLRSQMWYAVYEQQGFGMLLLSLSWVAGDLFRGGFPRIARFASAAVAVGMLVFAYRFGWITGPRNYPEKLQWGWGMTIEKTPPVYLSQEDKNAILGEISRHLDGRPRPVRVFFCPEADGLFFHGILPDGVIPYQGVRTDVMGDMAVFRFSRHMPEWARNQHVRKLLTAYDGGEVFPFRTRDGTESWLFVDGNGAATR
ncbi:MAG: hypothetical protein IJS32_03100 [Kiritimatiellae bacterium]|nr:hypothetical protein [Kiritimatiellia bacterium]